MGLFDDLLGLTGDGTPAGADEQAPGAGVPDPTILELGPDDFRRWADQVAEERVDLDFTLASLARLDEVVGEGAAPPAVVAERGDGRPTFTHGEFLLAYGSYLGEVLVGNFDGDWVNDDGWGVVVPVEDGTATVGVFDVAASSFVDEPVFGEVVETVGAGRGTAVAETGVPAGAARVMGASAASVAEGWPRYDLDRSPGSLLRLDELLAEQPSAADRTGSDGLGAYLGQVFVRGYGGEWRWSDAPGWVVGVRDGAGERAVLDVPTVVGDCLAGEGTFAGAHDALVGQFGLDAPELDVLAVAERSGEAATVLAEAWPAYGLDFSVLSLARLDELAADEYSDAAGREVVDPAELADRNASPGPAPAGGTAADPDDAPDLFGDYFAEVLRRHHDAAWRVEDGTAVLAVTGVDGTAELEPPAVATAALSGEVGFVDVYARMAASIDLSTPLD